MNYYDRAGEPIDFVEWGRLMEDDHYHDLCKTQVGDVLISTVWLGIDHSFGYGPLQIFETMTFGGEDGYCQRYATWADALEGHIFVVMMVRNKIGATQ